MRDLLRRRVYRDDLAPWALIAGVSLLSVAWIFGNTPFGSPDETQHFLRAVGVGHGHLIGPKVTYPSDGLSPLQYAWVEQAARGVRVPDGLSPFGSDCAAQRPELSAVCVTTASIPKDKEVGVQVGNYQPLSYLLPGVAMLRAHRPVPALYLARIASLAQTLPLLLFGIAALAIGRPRRSWSVVGAALALTPMVLFLCSSLNPSGLEIAASFAFAGCLFRLSERPSRTFWRGAAITSLLLGASRSSGAVWVLALVGLFVSWNGPRKTKALVRQWPAESATAGFGAALGIVLNQLWEARYGSRVTTIVPTISQAWTTTRNLAPQMSREAIGNFGYLNVKMPLAAYWLWGSLVVVLVLLGLWRATPYRRAVLVTFVVGVLVLPTAQHYYVARGSGYAVQARHLLPLLVVLPILAAESVRRSKRSRASVTGLFGPLVVVAVAAVQLVAWWTNARRAAVGQSGARLFFLSPSWSPPLGWYPWLFAALLGSALVVLAAVCGAIENGGGTSFRALGESQRSIATSGRTSRTSVT